MGQEQEKRIEHMKSETEAQIANNYYGICLNCMQIKAFNETNKNEVGNSCISHTRTDE